MILLLYGTPANKVLRLARGGSKRYAVEAEGNPEGFLVREQLSTAYYCSSFNIKFLIFDFYISSAKILKLSCRINLFTIFPTEKGSTFHLWVIDNLRGCNH